MNRINLQHPTTKEIRMTRDFSTAMSLLKQGYKIIPAREPATKPVAIPDGIETDEMSK